MSGLAWYWEALIVVGWLVVCIVLFGAMLDGKRAWPWATLLAVVFIGAPAAVIAWSWLDDDAPSQRCEQMGGIVVVTPAQGRACIDRSAVIPESEWRE